MLNPVRRLGCRRDNANKPASRPYKRRENDNRGWNVQMGATTRPVSKHISPDRLDRLRFKFIDRASALRAPIRRVSSWLNAVSGISRLPVERV